MHHLQKRQKASRARFYSLQSQTKSKKAAPTSSRQLVATLVVREALLADCGWLEPELGLMLLTLVPLSCLAAAWKAVKFSELYLFAFLKIIHHQHGLGAPYKIENQLTKQKPFLGHSVQVDGTLDKESWADQC